MARRIPPHFEVPRSIWHWTYVLARPLGRWAVCFWHRVEVDGLEHLADSSTSERPARLLFSAHQNGLADPILACVSLPHQLHYFTRADVFAHPVARFFVLRLNMMPMFRPIDRVADMADRNRTTFEAAHHRLDQGATCGIFPEAGHLDERRTRRFKHGSARFLLNAMQRPAIQQRGLDVVPMALDFERYEGYRSKARVRLGPPADLSGLPEGAEDAGHHRVWLSDTLREAYLGVSVELAEGEVYDAHLAVCRFEEGRTGGRPDPEWLRERGQALMAGGAEALSEFTALLEAGMDHPRRGDGFSALGRLHGPGPTRLGRHLWRLPAWAVFRLTTGWWPRMMEPMMARRIPKVGFRSTGSIPMSLVAVGGTWFILCLAISLWLRGFAFGLVLFVLLRLCQSLAMPFEDAWLDRAEEKRVAQFANHPWVVRWASATVGAPSS